MLSSRIHHTRQCR